jgi:hypothetical protein
MSAKKVTALEFLRHARGLLEKGFCHKSFAKDAAGACVSEFSKEAVQFCSLGAFERTASDLGEFNPTVYDGCLVYSQAKDYLSRAITAKGSDYLTVVGFNDASTQAEVLSAFDHAIELAQADQDEAAKLLAPDVGGEGW